MKSNQQLKPTANDGNFQPANLSLNYFSHQISSNTSNIFMSNAPNGSAQLQNAIQGLNTNRNLPAKTSHNYITDEIKKERHNNRTMFSQEEDEKLKEYYVRFNGNWKKISKEMKNRNVRQCKERYLHYLSPTIKHQEWSPEEDQLLESKVEEHGKRWKMFEFFFEGRTEIDIRNRYNVLIRRQAKQRRIEQKKLKMEQNSNPNLNAGSPSKENDLAKQSITENSELTHEMNFENALVNENSSKINLESFENLLTLTNLAEFETAIGFPELFDCTPEYISNDALEFYSECTF